MGIQTHVPCTAGNALSIWAKTSVQQFDISSLIILIFMEDIKQFNFLPFVIMGPTVTLDSFKRLLHSFIVIPSQPNWNGASDLKPRIYMGGQVTFYILSSYLIWIIGFPYCLLNMFVINEDIWLYVFMHS